MDDDITKTILHTAAKPGGFTAQPLGGLLLQGIHKRCARLVKEGRLFKARISHRTVRWYADKEAADTAIARHHDDAARKREGASARVHKKQYAPPADGPVQYHPDFKGVQKLEGFERYEARYTQAGAVSFGMQRGRVTR